MAQYQTPEEVVAQIPLESLRAICARDPNLSAIDSALAASLKLKDKEPQEDKENRPKSSNIATRQNAKAAAPEKKDKKLSAREARRRIVAEIERLAVRALTHHVPKQLLVAAVDELNIDHKAAGNCATSRSVAAKRLFEHISVSTGGVGLKPYLEEEASDELVADLVERLELDAAKLKKTSKATAATEALLHEATVAFFESFPEELLHDICFEMKNERASTETASKQLLVESIVSNVPVGDLIPDDEDTKKKKKQPKKLSKKKPKLVDGVSYEDVYQWYYLDELQDYARDHDIKVSGKKRDLILRILAFLATGETDVGRAKPKPQRKKKESKATNSDEKDSPANAKEAANDEHDGEDQGQEDDDEAE